MRGRALYRVLYKIHQLRARIEDPVSAAYNRTAAAEWTVGKAEAWSNIVLVGSPQRLAVQVAEAQIGADVLVERLGVLVLLGETQTAPGQARVKRGRQSGEFLRDLRVFVAQPDVERQLWTHLPVVQSVERHHRTPEPSRFIP